MEPTALRPRPMPGRETVPGDPSRSARGPRPAPRRGRRLLIALLVPVAAAVLVLAGVGLGTVGTAVLGAHGPADPRARAQAGGEREGAEGARAAAARAGGAPSPGASASASPKAGPAAREVRATLGVEAVDAAAGPGALLVGVHVPGPGHAAGLVRGDVLLTLGGTRVDSVADLVGAVAAAEPGTALVLTVRHASGVHQQLSVTPAVVT
ncbi:PDZ domain-containing protein [Streptomyces minutiscleroticus]|uniref:PDZ domain-containing protein n=1 Tax=Streptomyces minutiscleroticus TaxID=68238 RepID=UPI00332D7DF5